MTSLKRMLVAVLVLTALLAVSRGADNVAASRQQPQLFAPKAVLDRAWKHVTGFVPFAPPSAWCTSQAGGPNFHEDECYYRDGSAQVTADFKFGRTIKLRFDYPHPSAASWWGFLSALLPQGARKVNCKTAKPSYRYSFQNDAHVCFFRYRYSFRWDMGTYTDTVRGSTLIVARTYHPGTIDDDAWIAPSKYGY